VGSFTYLGSVISKDGESIEDVKSRIARLKKDKKILFLYTKFNYLLPNRYEKGLPVYQASSI